MSDRLGWYWHRLRAMSPAEMLLRVRQKQREFRDARVAWPVPREQLSSTAFPRLPAPGAAPKALRAALGRDARRILGGQWDVFGHLTLRVDDPPKWHCDYLSGHDLPTMESGFHLDHRRLPHGADIKLVWELSRWQHLTRLAMAAYVLNDRPAGAKCLEWLNDWAARNPPYHGWNWTSALEAGMRLIQFAWIDALLEASKAQSEDQAAWLRARVLPSHVRYVWRHKSFGSSANNHLLGELAGCILAVTRWPALARFSASLDVLQASWEREVLAQYHRDGGNREQALNYHLFSLELCRHSVAALENAGRVVSDPVAERLARAVEFYAGVQAPSDPWDYGDSDSAFVVPAFVDDAPSEWRGWCMDGPRGPGLRYWLGSPPAARARIIPPSVGGAKWRAYMPSGIAVWEADPWFLRLDASPLGYLSTAAHGHLDALHLSVWCCDLAFVVDPGTGAYFADPELRRALAARTAHNGPRPVGPERPARLGPFLWEGHHARPELAIGEEGWGAATLDLWGARIRRRVEPLAAASGFRVEDGCETGHGAAVGFRVRWQFAPDTRVIRRGTRDFDLERGDVSLTMRIAEGWSGVLEGDGIVSPAFRRVQRAPYLELTATPSHGSPPLHTTFIRRERS
jgi:hypothetical protein